jgi:citrate synthase
MPDVSAGSGVALSYNGDKLELPVTTGTEGASGIGVKSLLAETGMVTLDPGFVNTASCSSAITYIDGDAGILRYRGYPIEQLAEQSNFIEVCYLLTFGELPTKAQYEDFAQRIARETALPEGIERIFAGFPRDAHPMAVLSAAVSALATYYQDGTEAFDPTTLETNTVRLLAQVPELAAYILQHAAGGSFEAPSADAGLVQNFVRLAFAGTNPAHATDPDVVNALDLLFILHADHEQNCSTSTVRMVGSAQANLFGAIASGVNALAGPLHGGANAAVLEMLEAIKADGGDVEAFVTKVKNKVQGVKLMGFGHRVYKNYDPRAKIVKGAADRIIEKLAGHDPLLDIAKELEATALSDEYFVSRKLYPNVDFYTGLIYRAMGFPTDFFTVLFAIGRLPGWIAHYREMTTDPATKIGRPRQVYTGAAERAFTPIAER